MKYIETRVNIYTLPPDLEDAEDKSIVIFWI